MLSDTPRQGIPASVKDLTRTRPFIPGAAPSPFPLRCFDGRTWAERAADMKKDKAHAC